mmetsp:Transcript_101469/g.315602  ORF Transcript_101469/g.315602 Transcript_101469/m.315602 type:complete len:314 (-) Transcript_101469:50-991(-)
MPCCLERLLLRVDEAVPGRRQAGGLQRRARGVLVPRRVHGARRGPRQPQLLAEPRHEGHRELHQGADGVRRARGAVLAEAPDELQGVPEDLVGRAAHVHGDELGDEALAHEALCPGPRVLDDHGLDAQPAGPLEDEALAGVAGGQEDHGGAVHQPPPEGLALHVLRLQELRRQLRAVLVRHARQQRADGLLARLRAQGLRQAARRRYELLHLELGAGLGAELRQHVRAAQLAVHVQGHAPLELGAGGSIEARHAGCGTVVWDRRGPGLHQGARAPDALRPGPAAGPAAPEALEAAAAAEGGLRHGGSQGQMGL